ESHPEELEGQQVALRLGVRHALRPGELLTHSLELVALRLHEVRRRLGHEALVGELGLRARDLLLQALALGLRLARLRLAIDEVARADLDAAAGDAHGRGRLAVPGEVQTRHAGDEVGGAVKAVDARREHLAGLHAGLIAPRAQRG